MRFLLQLLSLQNLSAQMLMCMRDLAVNKGKKKSSRVCICLLLSNRWWEKGVEIFDMWVPPKFETIIKNKNKNENAANTKSPLWIYHLNAPVADLLFWFLCICNVFLWACIYHGTEQTRPVLVFNTHFFLSSGGKVLPFYVISTNTLNK